ncbi:hypothetical protein N9770_07600 [Amylibacter sp.]|nr:hypothetical protein [Amylibacter sp.]
MKIRIIIMLTSNFILLSCGTLNGTGSVLEGVAFDAQLLGNIF